MSEVLSQGLYLATFFPVIGILLCVLLYQAKCLHDIDKNTKILTQLDDWFTKRGIDTALGGSRIPHHSLPYDKAVRRDELIQLGSVGGLIETEAQELKMLLDEDARDDLVSGVLSLVAFVVILAGIAVVVDAITKK